MVKFSDALTENYSLDMWLRRLGLWRHKPIGLMTIDERKAYLHSNAFSKPLVLTGSSYDPEGYQLISMMSLTHYDHVSGILDDKIIYWRHTLDDDVDEAGKIPFQDYFVLGIRGVRDDHLTGEGVPVIVPDQIWWNGNLVFNGPANGGRHDPERPEQQRQINRYLEMSQQVKEHLNRGLPLEKIGHVFSQDVLSDHFSARALGGAPFLRGLSSSGWDNVERLLGANFVDLFQKEDQRISFRLPSLPEISSLDRLKALHGFYINSVEPIRCLSEQWDKYASDMRTGMGYVTETNYFFDEQKQRHIFSVRIASENPPKDMPKFEPYELIRLEYTQGEDVFTLEDSFFMGVKDKKYQKNSDFLSLIGALQDTNQALSERIFPDYQSILMRNKLHNRISEFRMPPKLSDGGEALWIPLWGTNMRKTIEEFGDGIGGGNLFMHRGRDDDNHLDEIAVLHGLPYQPGSPDSNYKGAQPSLVPYLDALRRGAIIIDHIHFDHSTIEFYATQKDQSGNGWFKGQKIICKGIDAYIMKNRLLRLGVKQDQWPEFIEFDRDDAFARYPNLFKDRNGNFAYRIQDEKGNTRGWNQICKDGTSHSALTDSYLITMCYNNNLLDTYYIDSDANGLNDNGWKFAEDGQFALEGIDGITREDLLKAVKSEDKLYISLEEPTGITRTGRCSTPEQFKDTFRALEKALPEGFAHGVIPFSTNHLEYQAIREVWAEKDTLRHTTAVGANAQLRDTALNIYGVNPKLDLRTVTIAHDHIPQLVYELLYDGMIDFMIKAEKKALRQSKREYESRTLDEILNDDVVYQKVKAIFDTHKDNFDHGVSQPIEFYNGFLNNQDGDLTKLMQSWLRKYTKVFWEGADKLSTAYNGNTCNFMLSKLISKGMVTFDSRCGHNDYNMYQAIMVKQDHASVHGVRTAKRTKRFRNDYGQLGFISTDPLGTSDSRFGSMSRFANGDSLFDYDEFVRNTGYKIDPEKLILTVTQTASMGSDAWKSQDQLMQKISHDRGVTVFCAIDDGFKIYNPREHRARYEAMCREEGWSFTGDGRMMYIHAAHSHIQGHRREQDMRDKMTDPRYKPKLVEVIHCPSVESLNILKNVVRDAGHRMTIKEPENNIARACEWDEKTQSYNMIDKDYLSERMMLINWAAKYGQMYNWVVTMTEAIVMPKRGGARADPLTMRSHLCSEFQQQTALRNTASWIRPKFGNSSRGRALGPAPADIREEGGAPPAPMMTDMLRRALISSSARRLQNV